MTQTIKHVYFFNLRYYDSIKGRYQQTTRTIYESTAERAVKELEKLGFSRDDVKRVWKLISAIDKELHIFEFDE